MKRLIIVISTLASLIFCSSAFAANQVNESQSKEKIGVVSASGAYSLDDLSDKLQQRAEAEGASSYKIISAGGNNQFFGVAEIYK